VLITKKIPISEYTQKKVHESEDGKVIYTDDFMVMMDWEKPLMKIGADTICWNGGDVLNVGFGMGIIDSYIREHNPKSHNIIEIHPDIHKKILEGSWSTNPNVNLYFGDWRDFLDELPKMDGIYFDTLSHQDFMDFISIAWRFLKKDGIFSFFNNTFDDTNKLHMNPDYEPIVRKYYNIEFDVIKIEDTDEELQVRYDNNKMYWRNKRNLYYSPVLKPKPQYRNNDN
jgi:SAM-dependent methyltransferase